jgi:hypothetical protein
MVANQGARRKRACILSVLPGWYVDAAVAACDKTLEDNMSKGGRTIEELRAEMISAFAEYGITEAQIAEKVGKETDKMNKTDIVKLGKLYSAIADGFVKPQQAFGAPEPEGSVLSDEEDERLDGLNKQLGIGD